MDFVDTKPVHEPAPLVKEMEQVLLKMRQSNRPPFHLLTPQEARALYAKGADILEPLPPQMKTEQEHELPSFDGAKIGIRIFYPNSTQDHQLEDGLDLPGALIFFHGGGFTIGSVQTHSALCKELAFGAQIPVISVEYRLAPEFKFPTAHLDAWYACEWVFNNAKNIFINASAIFLGGDSAGGTLSLFCAQQAFLTGHKLRGQILFYPGCSPAQNMKSHHHYSSGYLLESQTVEYFYAQYLRDANDRLDWRFSALNSPYLESIIPTWIGLAQCDPLRDEGTALYSRIRTLGRSAELKVYEGVVHGFIKMGRFIPQAIKAQQDAFEFIKRLT